MGTSSAELSSLSTALREMVARVGELAERATAERDHDLVSELFAVERALSGASRRLERLTSAR